MPTTDSGTRRTTRHGSRASNRLHTLHRIAEALDRPVSDFYPRDAHASEPDAPSTAECELMLRAFLRVKDAEDRTRIIAMMRACSGT